MRVEVYHHFESAGADDFENLMQEIRKMSAQLDALAAAVAANSTVTGSAIALLVGLHAKILDLLSQETIDPAAIQSLADDLSEQTQALAEAVSANTPA